MTRRAPRATLSAIVALILLAFVLATGLPQPGTAGAAHTREPVNKHATKKRKVKRVATKRAAGKHLQKTISPGLRAVQIANQLTGIPYRWGGASPRSGFDCSGFVQYVYAKVGVSLPHHAASQYGHGRQVPRGTLRPGDLVFFSGLGHVGIYAGGGKFIHAPQSGTTVRWSRLSSHGSYYGARRLVAAA